MEPVTHLLTGACLARAGANRRAAYATAAMTIAAYFPDIDTLWSLRGPVYGFAHHRGITHTFVGVPFEAALLTAVFYGLHQWRVQRRQGAVGAAEKPMVRAPLAWGRLYMFVCLALLSHLLLDFTNNYGLRPFLPFHPRWYAASIVFILDPLILLTLLMPFVLPPIFRLVSSEVGARKQHFPARGPAIVALLFVVSLWTMRVMAHARAVEIGMGQSVSVSLPGADGAPVWRQPERVAANPDPFNPFRWHMVTDFGDFYQLADVNLLNGTLTPGQQTFAKPPQTTAVRAAAGSQLGRAYLDWSPMPVVTESAEEGGTRVTFRDPRFMLDLPFFRSRTEPPLTGSVLVNAQGQVVEQRMDGKLQK